MHQVLCPHCLGVFKQESDSNTILKVKYGGSDFRLLVKQVLGKAETLKVLDGSYTTCRCLCSLISLGAQQISLYIHYAMVKLSELVCLAISPTVFS